ncbi:MAG: hypothetical protein K8R37_11250 [Bacteroidales bacterium]|nr:hypothetical protein [Bacteroidales bacterium]
MEMKINDQQLKIAFKDALFELFNENKNFVKSTFVEVIEDIAMGKAIKEGDKNDLVSEKEIFEILDK